MTKYICSAGLAILLILCIPACGTGSSPTGAWQLEVRLECAISTVHATIPFEVAEDMTLSGSGQVDGTYKLRPPLPCPEFREVNLRGTVSLRGSYTNAGGTGFVFDQFDYQTGSEYDPYSVCPGKSLDSIDKALIAMDAAMFITNLEQSWNTRIHISPLQKGNQEDAPDIKAQDGAEAVLQAGFCNVYLVLHRGK